MFEVLKKDEGSRARTGHLKTDHGIVETPSYVIVGTHGAVRCLDPEDLLTSKIQMVISNTYHLWRTLGEEGLNDFEGLHNYMEWPGAMMTDSGGFQVFSLGFLREQGMRRAQSGVVDQEADPSKNLVKITEAGVYFKPQETFDDEEPNIVSDDLNDWLYLDAETSIKIQEQLGADIIVAFDEPTAPLNDHDYTKQAMGRTHKWAERSLDAKRGEQYMYGVVQGGAFEDLRKESAKFIGSLPFDGFAIGSTYGDAYGGTKNKTMDMLEWSIPLLPQNKPRHLFGVGRIEDIFYGVEAGIDTFDCVIPTREARHGGIWTSKGRYDVKKGANAGSGESIDPECDCYVCGERKLTRGELYFLFKGKDLEAGRLATMHNIYFFNELMRKVREAITNGNFQEFKNEYLKDLKSEAK